MIRDYMLALLCVPLAQESAPARFADGSAEQWRGILSLWLAGTRDLDSSLNFELSYHEAGLSLRTRSPIEATVTFVLATEPVTATKSDGDLLVLVACCPQWTIEYGDDVLLVEPRWAAGILLDDAAPLFWGVSANELSPSVLDTPLAPCPTG